MAFFPFLLGVGVGWEKGNNDIFLFLCGNGILEEGEGNNAIFFLIVVLFVMAYIQ